MRKRDQAILDEAAAQVTKREIAALKTGLQLQEAVAALDAAVDLMRLLLRATSLKPKPGVYFLLDEGGDLLYVGKSDNVMTRMGGHAPKKFFDARMIHVPSAADQDRLERAFIHHFVPPLNVQLQAFNRSMELRAIARAEQKAVEARSMVVE